MRHYTCVRTDVNPGRGAWHRVLSAAEDGQTLLLSWTFSQAADGNLLSMSSPWLWYKAWSNVLIIYCHNRILGLGYFEEINQTTGPVCQLQVSSFCHAPWFLRQVLSFALCLLIRLGPLAVGSQGSFWHWVSYHATILSFLMWVLGTDIRSSCLCDEHCTHWPMSPSSLVSPCSPAGLTLKSSCLSRAVIIGVHHHACLRKSYLTSSVQMQSPRLGIPGCLGWESAPGFITTGQIARWEGTRKDQKGDRNPEGSPDPFSHFHITQPFQLHVPTSWSPGSSLSLSVSHPLKLFYYNWVQSACPVQSGSCLWLCSPSYLQ